MPKTKTIETLTAANGNTNGKLLQRKPTIKDFSDTAPHTYTKKEKALIESGQAVLEIIIKQKHEQVSR